MKKIIFIVLAILGLFMGCEVKNPTLPDETIPTAFVTYPANEETVTDNQINLSFDVDNETSIDSVQVYFNGNKIASLLQRPYQIMISKEDYEVGTQTIYCKAFDRNGKIGISEISTFYWLDDEDLSDIKIEFLRPILWEEYPTSVVNVNLLVESEQDIDSIFVYVDGNLVYTFNQEPYQTILQVNNPGTHNIYAKAKDVLNSVQITDIVNFSINLPDQEAPSGFITFPADWNDVSGNLDVRVSAIDNIEISKIELYIDGEFVMNVTAEPYEFQIDSTTLTNGNHTIFAKIIDSSQLFSYTQMINIRVEN
jgi:hypothetical protein